MKLRGSEIVGALVFGVLLPWLLFGAAWEMREKAPVSGSPAVSEPVEEQAQQVSIPVYTGGEGIADMELEEYITGVLLCEMPASFAFEAKKAQAVVARTYALRTVGRGVKHTPPGVCTQPSCCQGYRSVEEFLESGGSREAVEQARAAALETRGLVLTYEGALAEATYFSCSGGMTEAAVAVWGSDIPYLQAVESPGEEYATHYSDTVTFTPGQLQQALGVTLSGKPESWFQLTAYTSGGGVESMVIGGTTFSGTQLRSLLSLRSTAFTVSVSDGLIRITTRGFGHRVGMSQYGADAMAAAGCGFEEILGHYYPGTTIDKAADLG